MALMVRSHSRLMSTIVEIQDLTLVPGGSVRLGDLTPAVDERPDGTVILRAVQPLGDYPTVLTDRLAYWARHAPERTLLAWNRGRRATNKRTTDKERRTTRITRIESGRLRSFERLTYADALEKVRRLGQALLDCHLTADRPLAILSGNSVEHLLLALAAQHVGVPYAPISPAYSLVSTDFTALKHVIGLLSPGLVFVSDRTRFARALDAAVGPDVEVVHGESATMTESLSRHAGRRGRSSRCSRRSQRATSIAGTRVDRARQCREDPVHVGFDGHAEGRDQYAPHALQQPAGDPADAAVPRRRATGARRLAALASHLRRQPQRRDRGL